MSISDELFNLLDARQSHLDLSGQALLTGRCEIFGKHDSGPKHLQGGRFGPEYNGKIHWYCQNPWEVRVIMRCPYDHRGPVMKICRPHMAQCQKRMAGRCTACAQPPEQISLEEQFYDYGYRFERAKAAGDYDAARALASRLEDVSQLMQELVTRGIVRAVPLKLEEVS